MGGWGRGIKGEIVIRPQFPTISQTPISQYLGYEKRAHCALFGFEQNRPIVQTDGSEINAPNFQRHSAGMYLAGIGLAAGTVLFPKPRPVAATLVVLVQAQSTAPCAPATGMAFATFGARLNL